jgi:hypothetical protein
VAGSRRVPSTRLVHPVLAFSISRLLSLYLSLIQGMLIGFGKPPLDEGADGRTFTWVPEQSLIKGRL